MLVLHCLFLQSSGNYEFGYDVSHTTGSTFHKEKGSPGVKIGSYGLRNVDGRVRVVNYVADSQGFRANVRTNEPGVETSDPAGVTISRTPPVIPLPPAPFTVEDDSSAADVEEPGEEAANHVPLIMLAPVATRDPVSSGNPEGPAAPYTLGGSEVSKRPQDSTSAKGDRDTSPPGDTIPTVPNPDKEKDKVPAVKPPNPPGSVQDGVKGLDIPFVVQEKDVIVDPTVPLGQPGYQGFFNNPHHGFSIHHPYARPGFSDGVFPATEPEVVPLSYLPPFEMTYQGGYSKPAFMRRMHTFPHNHPLGYGLPRAPYPFHAQPGFHPVSYYEPQGFDYWGTRFNHYATPLGAPRVPYHFFAQNPQAVLRTVLSAPF